MPEGLCFRVPFYLTEEQKLKGKNVSSHLLERYSVEGDEFLYNIVIGDESRFHKFDPETKRQSMERDITRKRNPKQCPRPLRPSVLSWDVGGRTKVELCHNGKSADTPGTLSCPA
jgi:hypothetical protein